MNCAKIHTHPDFQMIPYLVHAWRFRSHVTPPFPISFNMAILRENTDGQNIEINCLLKLGNRHRLLSTNTTCHDWTRLDFRCHTLG